MTLCPHISYLMTSFPTLSTVFSKNALLSLTYYILSDMGSLPLILASLLTSSMSILPKPLILFRTLNYCTNLTLLVRT